MIALSSPQNGINSTRNDSGRGKGTVPVTIIDLSHILKVLKQMLAQHFLDMVFHRANNLLRILTITAVTVTGVING